MVLDYDYILVNFKEYVVLSAKIVLFQWKQKCIHSHITVVDHPQQVAQHHKAAHLHSPRGTGEKILKVKI